MTDPVPVVRVGAYAVVVRDGAVLLTRYAASDLIERGLVAAGHLPARTDGPVG